MNIMICGQGGIGQAITKALQDEGHQVYTLSRRTNANLPLNICDSLSISAIKTYIEKINPNIVINTTGVLADTTHFPEKKLSDIDDQWLLDSIKVNVLSSIHLAQALQAYVKQHPIIFAAFSARVGSISDNRLGGWYSYRMSKAMLNMFLKNLSIEWHRQNKKNIVIGYHPGTVATPLSEQFSKNIPEHKIFSPEQASNYFLKVLATLDAKSNGKILDWQNKIIGA